MRKIAICALAALSVAACATTPAPNSRPLNATQIEAMGPTPVVVAENNFGVTKSWYMSDSSAAGAGYGLIGALVSVAIDAIMNLGPSGRAHQAADEIARIMPVDTLNASLVDQFRRQIAAAPAGGVVVSEVTTVQKVTSPLPVDDAIEVAVSYNLSEDASTLQVLVAVTYQNVNLPYVTPYTFEGGAPKSELSGPVYRNTFTYSSRQLPLPVLTPELKERLIASVQDSARDAAGALPVEGTDAFKSMTKELEQARDDNLSKAEIAIFLVREWIKNDGALLRAEIENAHSFIAKYAVLDLNRTAIPSLTGQDEVVETMADGRTVRRIGAGVIAGSYVSSPAEVTGFTTYGNAIAVAEAHRQRLDALRASGRTAARAGRQ